MQGALLRIKQAPLANRLAAATHRISSRRCHVSAIPNTTAAADSMTSTSAASSWRPGCQIRMLYDGECSLCMKEVKFLMKRDAGAGKIDFVDIAAPSYQPSDNAGITFEQAMERIHAILPDGTIVKDIEVFRRLYEAVGLGWVYAVTKYKPIETAGNAVYNVWAQYRTQITGREALGVILARHRAQQEGRGSAGSLCRDADGNLTTAACELPQQQ